MFEKSTAIGFCQKAAQDKSAKFVVDVLCANETEKKKTKARNRRDKTFRREAK